MRNFFTKSSSSSSSSSKKKAQPESEENFKPLPRPSRKKTPSSSPTKLSSRSPSKPLRHLDPHSGRKQSASSNTLRKKISVDTHPLNLPPEERERRRSAMSTSSDSPGPYPTEDDVEMGDMNGVNGYDDSNDDDTPSPPPHKVPSPPPKPAFDPEACKATGNKYFKAKDYTKAIAEYTKGESCLLCVERVLYSFC